MPLLVNLCSTDCENKLPKPAEGYVECAHKGGANLKQPLNDFERFEQEMLAVEASDNAAAVGKIEDEFLAHERNETEVANIGDAEVEDKSESKQTETEPQYLKFIKKIWEK